MELPLGLWVKAASRNLLHPMRPDTRVTLVSRICKIPRRNTIALRSRRASRITWQHRVHSTWEFYKSKRAFYTNVGNANSDESTEGDKLILWVSPLRKGSSEGLKNATLTHSHGRSSWGSTGDSGCAERESSSPGADATG